MKNCLVTGATGFIGKRLVEKLLTVQLKVYGVSRSANNSFTNKNYKHVKCNLEKSEIPISILNKIDTVKDKQEEMADDIGKIKEAVYNPDSGLYARLRELESWKETSTRIIWMVVSAVVALSVATIYKSLL